MSKSKITKFKKILKTLLDELESEDIIVKSSFEYSAFDAIENIKKDVKPNKYCVFYLDRDNDIIESCAGVYLHYLISSNSTDLKLDKLAQKIIKAAQKYELVFELNRAKEPIWVQLK